jgi:hypothetical protein
LVLFVFWSVNHVTVIERQRLAALVQKSTLDKLASSVRVVQRCILLNGALFTDIADLHPSTHRDHLLQGPSLAPHCCPVQ